MVLNFLFPNNQKSKETSLIYLAIRLLFGSLLIIHGYGKLADFELMSAGFHDPIGVGSKFSLILAIFAEMICGIAFIFGFLYRLTLIPMIITMLVAFFVIHGADPFQDKELAFIYLVVFLIMYIAGPGNYSIDTYLRKHFNRE